MTSTLTLNSDPFRILGRAEAMALPQATLTKIYAEFKLFGFGYANANKDGFRFEDVTDEAVATLVGAPVYAAQSLGEHPEKDSDAGDRARYQVGSVVLSEKRADGVYCVASLQRSILRARGIDPDRLDRDFAVSMEVTFDRTRAKYKVGGTVLAHRETPADVIAGKLYDVRFIQPLDYHGIAVLTKGKNADQAANFLRVAADRDESDDPFRVSPETVERIQRSDS